MSSPALPPDLERHIFILTAELHRGTASVLILVAQRVHSWVQLILYRSLDLEDGLVVAAFMHTAKNNPSVLAIGVREMIVPQNEYTGTIGSDSLHEAIRLCSQLERLSFSDNLTTSGLFSVLSTLRIRRLVVTISKLLPVPPAPPLSPAEFGSAFRHLTHLEILDDKIYLPDAKPDVVWSLVTGLPALTHLAGVFPTGSTSFDLDAWLERLPQLRAFVIIAGSPVQPIHDQRIVTTYWDEWHEGSSDMKSYWDRAEEFLERKSRGEVPDVDCEYAADYLDRQVEN